MSVWLVIPANGRTRISEVGFAGIAWLIARLAYADVETHALVVAEDDNLDIAAHYGLETLERPNRPLGRKWNDGIEYALEQDASHVMPCGSDDWVHPDLIRAHLGSGDGHTMMCSRLSTVIAPDGHEATTLRVGYDTGDGIRLIPRAVLEQLGGRPYGDSRDRALDGSMIERCRRARVGWEYTDLHPWQIVEFKSGENITPYDRFPGCEHEPVMVTDPLAVLAEHYPADLVDVAKGLYQ